MTPCDYLQGELNYFHFSDEETEAQGTKRSDPSKVTQAVTDRPRAEPPYLAVPSLSEPSASHKLPVPPLNEWVEKRKWLRKGTGVGTGLGFRRHTVESQLGYPAGWPWISHTQSGRCAQQDTSVLTGAIPGSEGSVSHGEKATGLTNPAPPVTAGPTCSGPPQPPSPHSALFTGPSAGSSSARSSRRPTCPDASVAGSLPTPPVPRHRKSHSLGNKWVTGQASPGSRWAERGPRLGGAGPLSSPRPSGVADSALGLRGWGTVLRRAQCQQELGWYCWQVSPARSRWRRHAGKRGGTPAVSLPELS